MATMRAALLYGAEDLRLVDLPMPEYGPKQVLLKVLSCSICPTDIRKYRLGARDHSIKQLPMNLGHEWVGEVVEVGSQAKGWKVGQRVMGPGFVGYAGYAAAPPAESPVEVPLTIPDNVASEDASMLEPLADCIHSLRDQAQLKVGQTVLILGGGPMGLMHVMVAKSMGSNVLVSEPDQARRAWATKFGADVTIDPLKEDLVSRVKEITAGKGADSVIVAIGIPALIPQALEAVKPTGRVVLFAGIPVGSQPAAVDFNVIHYREIVLTGCEWVGIGPNRDLTLFQVALDLIAKGRAPVGQLITHRFSLEEVHEAFRVASSREGLKVIVYPWGVPK